MTEKQPSIEPEKSFGQKWVDANRSEVPEGVDSEIFEKIKLAIAAYIDGKMDYLGLYSYFRDLALPEVGEGTEPPNEVTFAYLRNELELISAEGW